MLDSTYYYLLQKINVVGLKNKGLSRNFIEALNHHKGIYGTLKVHHDLINLKYNIHHKSVHQLRKIMNLSTQKKKREYHSYKSDIDKTAHNIMARDFNADITLKNV